jgi:hypothetical protein
MLRAVLMFLFQSILHSLHVKTLKDRDLSCFIVVCITSAAYLRRQVLIDDGENHKKPLSLPAF